MGDRKGNGMDGLQAEIRKKLRDFTLDVAFDLENQTEGGTIGGLWEPYREVSRRNGQSCVGILGASGCGKSMMLKSIAGIVKPDEGMIRLNGRTLYDSAAGACLAAQKRRVGYLFQDYALFPNMTVEENIAVGLKTRIYRKKNAAWKGDSSSMITSPSLKPALSRRERVAELIRQFRLEGLERQYPNRLSGGQKQRVALARILCYEPEMIMLDEPFSAMDAHLKERLRLELMEVLGHYRGLSLLVTHDRDEAYQLCDRLLLMDQGRIIGRGRTKEIFENPRTVKAASITGCKNISRAVRINPHRVKALDWGVELETARTVEDSITHIGIRAHDMIPVGRPGEAEAVNEVTVGNAHVSEMPFEWYVTLENGLWWKVGKHAGEYTHQFVIPQILKIPREAILLLRE